MKNKRFVLIVATLFVLASVLTAQCTPKPEATTAPPTEEKVFKVGLLSPGPVHDQGWNQLAYDSLMKIKDTLGAEVSYVELADSPADFEKAFTDFASQGYDLVIGHGFQFQDSAEVVSKKFPETIFLTSGGTKYGPNFAPVNFREEQVYYLAGLIGASMTKTGKAAGVGGEEIPAITMTFNGFKAGFETKSGNSFTTTYINSWTNINAGKEAAMAAFAGGADIVIPNANLAGQGVFKAAEENDKWAFGTNSDQNNLSPDHILASVVLDYPEAYLAIAKTVKDGTFTGNKPLWVGLENEKAEYLVYNPKLESKIPAEVKAQVEEARKKIISGEIVVTGGYE